MHQFANPYVLFQITFSHKSHFDVYNTLPLCNIHYFLSFRNRMLVAAMAQWFVITAAPYFRLHEEK